MRARGGGDGPEAVFDGLIAATKLKWRKHAMRLAILLGDAPPHGYGWGGDRWPEGCPCGENAESTAAHLEGANIIMYSIGLNEYPNLAKSFGEMSSLTGGQFFELSNQRAISTIVGILEEEFDEVELDRKVYKKWKAGEYDPATLAAEFEVSEAKICNSYQRLCSRSLITEEKVAV